MHDIVVSLSYITQITVIILTVLLNEGRQLIYCKILSLIVITFLSRLAMGKMLQIVHVVMILMTTTVNMTNAQGEVISMNIV